MPDDKLKFKVAPHIVQDLGLNLYTTLPRVLVEFVANTYDADSPHAKIELDKERVDSERKVLKARWEQAKAEAEKKKELPPRLAEMTLPENQRPDLVFLLGNTALSRLVIVEFKAPNTPLYGEHFRQLQGYVRRAEKWLKRHQKDVRVEGLLIGSFGPISSQADDVEWLDAEIKKTHNQGQIRTYGIDAILEMAQDAHKELMDTWDRAQEHTGSEDTEN